MPKRLKSPKSPPPASLPNAMLYPSRSHSTVTTPSGTKLTIIIDRTLRTRTMPA